MRHIRKVKKDILNIANIIIYVIIIISIIHLSSFAIYSIYLSNLYVCCNNICLAVGQLITVHFHSMDKVLISLSLLWVDSFVPVDLNKVFY